MTTELSGYRARCMKEKLNGQPIVDPQLKTVMTRNNKPRYFVVGICGSCGSKMSTTVNKETAKRFGASGAGVTQRPQEPVEDEWSEEEEEVQPTTVRRKKIKGKGTEYQAVGAEPLVYDFIGAPQPKFPYIAVHRTASGKLLLPTNTRMANDIVAINKQSDMVGGSVLEDKSPDHKNKMLALSKEIGHAVEKVYGGSPYFVGSSPGFAGGAPGFVGGFVPALLGTLGASLLSPIISQLVGGLFGSGLVVPGGITVDDSDEEEEAPQVKQKKLTTEDPEDIINKILKEIGIK